jgi:hypothetical protein
MIRTRQIIILLLLTTASVFGQMSNTLYFMDRIPQFQQLNPAAQPKCNVYIGFPALSSFQFNIGNNSLNMGNIWTRDPNSDSMLFFMANAKTKADFINTLKTENSFFTNFQVDAISFGFRVQSWYFNFSTSVKSDFSASYPKDFVKLMIYGLGPNASYDLKAFGINSTAYSETAFGISKIINDEFTVGAKAKLLIGLFNISTDNNKLDLKNTTTSDSLFEMSINSDLTLNTYIPKLKETPDTDNISLDNVFVIDDNAKFDPFNSKGFAVDFGIIYTGIDRLKLSASLLDLGYITWSKNVANLNLEGLTKYSGTNINKDSIGNAVTNLSDSIIGAYKFRKTSNSFTTALPTKLYIGAEFMLQSYFSVGLLSLSQYYRQQYYQQIMAAANLRVWRMIMLSATYSVFDNGFSNMGVGATFRLAPIQFYFVSDNIPLRVSKDFMPYKLEYLNFRFGFNWVFGCSNKKKDKDKPLSWE